MPMFIWSDCIIEKEVQANQLVVLGTARRGVRIVEKNVSFETHFSVFVFCRLKVPMGDETKVPCGMDPCLSGQVVYTVH